jgi:four helix bundle protein
MPTSLEELAVLKSVEAIADDIWKIVIRWQAFERDTISKQLVRAIDSIGANIAEAYGRYHFGEKLRFLYFARGSLYETKYWLNRCDTRGLLTKNQVEAFTSQLTLTAKQINVFANSLKTQRTAKRNRKIGESEVEYSAMPNDIQIFRAKD